MGQIKVALVPGLARTEQMFISFLFLWVIWISKTWWDKAKITTGKIEVRGTLTKEWKGQSLKPGSSCK